MLSIKELKRPAVITAQEITDKLAHLRTVLTEAKKTGIYLTAEGALRWLCGVRQQITDIAPDAVSPVNALCILRGKTVEITFVSAPFENPRIKDEIPPMFKGVKDVSVKFATVMPKTAAGILLPGAANYAAVQGRIVRPLIGGFTGNQYKKYVWTAGMMSKVIAESAMQLEVGMNGNDVRALIFKNFADHGLETNMLLIALKGQGHHLHPLYGEQYKVAPNHLMKLVSAGRFGDVIVSETQMVKIGKLTAAEDAAYKALQEAAVEYADLYRCDADEHDLYLECGRRFNRIEKKYGLKGFGKSAYLHHLGGPTSPLGNRDYCLDKNSRGRCFAGMAFAINPCECLCGTKVEVQGTVTAEGAPRMLDTSIYTDKNILTFRDVVASGGTVCRVPNILLR